MEPMHDNSYNQQLRNLSTTTTDRMTTAEFLCETLPSHHFKASVTKQSPTTVDVQQNIFPCPWVPAWTFNIDQVVYKVYIAVYFLSWGFLNKNFIPHPIEPLSSRMATRMSHHENSFFLQSGKGPKVDRSVKSPQKVLKRRRK